MSKILKGATTILNKLSQYFNAYLIISIGFITNNFSSGLRVSTGKLIGNILMILSKKRRKITFDNISNAFPELNNIEINVILKHSYQNLGITLIELLYIKKLSNEELKNYIEYENIELIEELLSRGKGLLLLSGHYGNWEYLAYSAGIFTGKQLNVIVKNQKNKILNKILNQYRSKSGNNLIPMNKAALEIIRVIKNKGMVALLADQSASKNKDIFVDFFGRPAITYEAPAKLALKFEIPIIMGFAERQSNNKYKVKLFEIKYEDIKNSENAIELLTQRHVSLLEKQIRKNPNQWAWQHKRWKHTIN